MRYVLFVCTHNAGRPQKLSLEMQLHADWAITLACGGTCPYVPSTVEDWDIPDPAERSLEEVRTIRDALETRVKDLLENRIEAIRSDRTAHELRLGRLLPGLIEEFGATHADEEIRLAADAALTDFVDAPVRSFVMTIANRKARERLRSESAATSA